MAAGEAELPRLNLPKAFKSVFIRLTTFFVVGSLCVGIVVPYDSPELIDALLASKPGAGILLITLCLARRSYFISCLAICDFNATTWDSHSTSYCQCPHFDINLLRWKQLRLLRLENIVWISLRRESSTIFGALYKERWCTNMVCCRDTGHRAALCVHLLFDQAGD